MPSPEAHGPVWNHLKEAVASLLGFWKVRCSVFAIAVSDENSRLHSRLIRLRHKKEMETWIFLKITCKAWQLIDGTLIWDAEYRGHSSKLERTSLTVRHSPRPSLLSGSSDGTDPTGSRIYWSMLLGHLELATKHWSLEGGWIWPLSCPIILGL